MSQPRRPLRLLHTSDVHLGGGFRTPDVGDHTDHCLCPLLVIEDLVVREQVDIMLVVGDLFDHQRVGSDFVSEVLGRLGRLGVPCVVINGNHDVHDERSIWDPESVGRSGVVFIDDHEGELHELLDGDLTLWGKAMPIHDRDFRPLQNAPDRPRDDAWWLVVGHGHYEPEADDQFGRSSPLSPDDIEATGADYVALGHWHVRTDVSTGTVPAWYSGAPHGVAASGQMNLIELVPGTGAVIDSILVELPSAGCAGAGVLQATSTDGAE